MAAGRIVVPNFMPAVDDNGFPLPGARLFVYTNRTTTLAVVYADEALTIPLPNPVLADASGQFVPIWQDDAFFFSVSFDSSAGLLGTFDDLQPSNNIGGALDKLDRDGGNPEPTFLENVGAVSSAALALPSGGSLVRTIRAETGAIQRSVQDVLRDRVSVKDFGAIGDGSSHQLSTILSFNGQNTSGWTLTQWQAIYPFADSLTNEIDWCAHQAAVNTGDLVNVPAGVYQMGVKTVNVRSVVGNDGAIIKGDNWGATRWVFTGTSGDCFNFLDVTGAGIYDGTIDCIQVRTSGAAIRFSASNDLRSSGIRCKAISGGKFYDCFVCDGATTMDNRQFLYKFDDYQLGDCFRGIVVGSNSGGFRNSLVQDVWIGRGVINLPTEECVLLLNCSGVFFHGWPDFLGGKHAVKTFPGSGQIVTAVLSSGFLADTSGLHGVFLTTNGGSVSNVNMTLWAASSGVNGGVFNTSLCSGVNIDKATGLIDGVRLAGEFYANITSGIAVIAATNVLIDGAMVGYNSIGQPSGFAGIYIGAGADNTTISGCKSGRYGLFGVQLEGEPPAFKVHNQTYGIQVDTGATDTVITGCHVQGNVIGGITNAGTRTVFGAIRGYRTKAEFVWAITAGNSTSNVTVPIDPTLIKDRVKVIDSSGRNIVCSSVAGQVATFTSVSGNVPSDTFFNVSVDQSEDFGPTYAN